MYFFLFAEGRLVSILGGEDFSYSRFIIYFSPPL